MADLAGFTNFYRHTYGLAALVGIGTTEPATLFVNLLTTNPTTFGTQSASLNGAVEWSLARIELGIEGDPAPSMLRGAGDNGGWMAYNNGEFEWGSALTAALAEDTTIVGVGLFAASSGTTLLASAALNSPRVVPVGGEFTFESGDLEFQMQQDLTR